jgi:DNA excision repair protein ERCC-6-like
MIEEVLRLEQGHKLKNPKTQLVQKLEELPVAVRVILSGTPVQNNLGEMHALFDFACKAGGHLLLAPPILHAK